MRTLLTILLVAASAAAQDARVELRQIAAGLEMPVAVAHAHDTRLFIVQQRGTIVVYNGGAVSPTPFLDLRPLVSCCGERGLLGLVFHPRFAQNRFFYVYYTGADGDIFVRRYTATPDGTRGDPNTGLEIIRIEHSQFSNHNGGQLAFGPDGFLYLGTGDGGSGGDPNNNGQNLLSHLGKILRLDVDSGSPYAIPASNPFRSRTDARPEIWAYGLRNPWRFSFDRLTGDLWIGDVGQNLWEEVNFQPATSIGGENYGWRRMEGAHCYQPATNCQDASMVLPVIEYGRTGGACTVIGGYRYRGAVSPRLRGMYIYADYCNGVISAAGQQLSGGWTSRVLFNAPFSISTFGEDAAGEIYVADYDSGRLFHLVDAAPLGPKRRTVRR